MVVELLHLGDLPHHALYVTLSEQTYRGAWGVIIIYAIGLVCPLLNTNRHGGGRRVASRPAVRYLKEHLVKFQCRTRLAESASG